MNILFFTVFTLLSFGEVITESLQTIKDNGCDYTITSQDLNASLIISALFPIQSAFQELVGNRAVYRYSPYAITWVESFLYSIDAINKNDSILPNIRLGYDVRNTCNDERVAIKHTLDFMLDRMYIPGLLTAEQPMNVSSFEASGQCTCPMGKSSTMVGVVGGARSMISSSVSYLLSTKNIPQISYASTSPSLSNKAVYPNFLRTVPSDLKQIEAIVDLLKHFNWTYISALAEDDDYGRLAIDSFREKIKLAGMCLAADLLFDSTLPHELNKTIKALEKEHEKSQVVVLWCGVDKAKDIIRKATQLNNLNNILWIIGTETLGASEELKKINRDVNIITLKVAEYTVPSFIKHTKQLQFTSPLQNTWLSLMWASGGYCPDNPDNRTDCINIQPSGSVLPTDQHENIMAAVYAFAHGLHHMLECEQNLSACHLNMNSSFDYNKFLSSMYHENNAFYVPSTNLLLDFDENGDVDVNMYKYLFIRTRRITDIGGWDGKTKSILNFNDTLLWSNFKKNNGTLLKPTATCAYPCQPGTYKLPDLKSCCWECIPCSQNTISSYNDANECTQCRATETANNDHTMCLPLKDKSLTFSCTTCRPILAMSAIGILLTCIVMACFFKHWNTPLVKSSSREMSLIQFFSMIILFSLPVLHMLPLTTYLCVQQTVVFGTFHTLIIAFIFIKTNRLLKVFQPARITEISKYLHNRYQILPSIVLVMLQIAVLTVWYSVHLPNVRLHLDRSDNSYVYFCDVHERMLLYAVVGYLITMSLLTGYMGFRARKLPSNFNEAQFIYLAMFTSCLTWICFYPLHLSAPHWNRPIIFLSVNMVSTFSLLVILYGYKIRIMLFYPHLNTQEHFSRLAANATVQTFLKEVDPSAAARLGDQPLRQSVISFDFDGMFDEYKKIKRRKSTFRENFHFPTAKEIRKSFRRRKKESTKKRRRTLELKKKHDDEGRKLPRNRMSFDESVLPPSTSTVEMDVDCSVDIEDAPSNSIVTMF